MISYIVFFLLGICSHYFYSELPSFKVSILIAMLLLLLTFLLANLLKFIQKKLYVSPEKIPGQGSMVWRLIQLNKNILLPIMKPITQRLFWFMLTFILGYFWMWVHIYINLAKRLPENLAGEVIQVVGTIVSLPETQDGGVRFEFDVKNTLARELWNNPGRIMLSYYEAKQPIKNKNALSGLKIGHQRNEKFKAEDLRVGDEWQFWVKLKKPRSYSNTGSFDKEKYYFQNRLQAEGRILLKLPKRNRNKQSNLNASSSLDNVMAKNNIGQINCSPKKLSSHWYSMPVHRLRAFLYQKIKIHMENRTFGPLITALVLGVREGISQEQWAVFRDTGTAHLMAISGLHVGLVASVAYLMIQLLYRCLPYASFIFPAVWIAAFAAIGIAAIYAALAGFSISTQRALVMITLFMSGMLNRRLSHVWKSYFVALAVVLILDPFPTLSIGFWLSFVAVGMMLYGLKGRLYPTGLWWKWGRAQWVIFLGLMPLTVASFNQISLVSPLSNILAIPWVSFTVVPPALLGSLVLIFSETAGKFLLTIAENSFSYFWPILNFFAKMPKAIWIPAVTSNISLIIAFMGTILLLMPKGMPGRFLGCLALLPLFLSGSTAPALGTAKFTLLDVGQGLAAVLQTQHHVLVFDTGPRFGPEVDTGSRVVLPFLESQGIKKIDAVVISHGDNDHIGGLASILKKMPVDTILTSEMEVVQSHTNSPTSKLKNFGSLMNPKIKPCYAGQHWHWDGVDFEMLHPDTIHTAKRNDHCCVLQVRAGKQAILLTGDIEQSSEKKLLDKPNTFGNKKLASTLLVVPHHGSRTSSSLDFIQAVNPAYALIPVGYLNQYGHPKNEILERYRQLKIPLFDSVRDGAISFILKDQEAIEKPTSYRAVNKHFWQWAFH